MAQIWSHTSDMTILLAWHYSDSARTSWLGVCILWQGGQQSLICIFCLSVAVCTIVKADLSVRSALFVVRALREQPTHELNQSVSAGTMNDCKSKEKKHLSVLLLPSSSSLPPPPSAAAARALSLLMYLLFQFNCLHSFWSNCYCCCCYCNVNLLWQLPPSIQLDMSILLVLKLIVDLYPTVSSSSSSSAFPSYVSGVHDFLGEIFAYVTVF